MKVLFVFCVTLGLFCASNALAGRSQDGSANGPTYGWVTEKEYEDLLPHPRLFITDKQLQRMLTGRSDAFDALYHAVERAAEAAVADADDPLADQTVWRRAIHMQDRAMALILQWHRTQDRQYLDAILRDIEVIRRWANRRQIGLPEGQFATVVAVAYDLLYEDLTHDQRERLIQIARNDFLLPFLSRTAPMDREDWEPGERRSWWQDTLSNWNPVSSSGNGVLALAMYEEIPEAQTVIDRVNSSYEVIFSYLQETEGGWVEGLGYWNWSMRYMTQFLMSYERSTGTELSGFRSLGFRQALTFGTFFVPHGEACGFGNNQHGRFSPHLASALEHLGDKERLLRVMEFFGTQERALRKRAERKAAQTGEPVEYERAGGPHELLLMPDPPERLPTPRENKMHTFPKQGWSMLADQWPEPTIYAAVRGGQLGGHHTHQDLLSWHGVVGMERMIINLTASDYFQTAWAGRAHEIYEKGSASKNTLFIGGLSAYHGSPRQRGYQPAQAHETHFALPIGPALRLDATGAYWLTRGEPHIVCRMFVVVEDKGLLVLDRVRTRGVHPVEARAYTEKHVKLGEHSVLLQGQFETARMTFAADVPAVLRKAPALLTDGYRTPPTMLRWQTRGQESSLTLASFLTRGDDEYDLVVESDQNTIAITMSSGDWSRTLHFDGQLKPDVDTESTYE